MATNLTLADDRDPLDGWSLPAWTYHDVEFFELEKQRIFAPSWQIVCHESDVPQVGDWHKIDYLGESIIIIRGKDRQLRAFANVCRHRGSRIVDGPHGCARKLICPYHAWTYELDGRLTGVPDSASYPTLNRNESGLAAVAMEIWRGFIFVRLVDEGPSVQQMMAPYDAMIAPYQFEKLQALGRVTMRPRDVNWKNIGDNYSDGLHIPIAHPGLTRLFGRGYGVEAQQYVDHMWGHLVDRPSENWSEKMYQALLPPVPHLPDDHQRYWQYFKLWPNVAFDIYPDQVDFMQWLPISPTQSLIREISYAVEDADPVDERACRQMRVARYLNWRINRQVNAEDTVLITRVQEGMNSRTFTMGPLSDKEVCLKHFCKRMRDIIPEARQPHQPAAGWSHR